MSKLEDEFSEPLPRQFILKRAWKVTCREGKSPSPGRREGTIFELCHNSFRAAMWQFMLRSHGWTALIINKILMLATVKKFHFLKFRPAYVSKFCSIVFHLISSKTTRLLTYSTGLFFFNLDLNLRLFHQKKGGTPRRGGSVFFIHIVRRL